MNHVIFVPLKQITTEASICSICHCDKDKKSVNCANQNLNNAFSINQWMMLANDSADAMETVMYVMLIQFPIEIEQNFIKIANYF